MSAPDKDQWWKDLGREGVSISIDRGSKVGEIEVRFKDRRTEIRNWGGESDFLLLEDKAARKTVQALENEIVYYLSDIALLRKRCNREIELFEDRANKRKTK